MTHSTRSSQTSHVDMIVATEKEAEQIIADARKKQHSELDTARENAQKKKRDYLASVRSADNKRLTAQKQELATEAEKIMEDAQQQAEQLAHNAQQHKAQAVKMVVETLLQK